MKTKRIFCILLSVLLVFASFPLSAFAEAEEQLFDIDGVPIVESGFIAGDFDMWGEYDNIHWSYDSTTKTLYYDTVDEMPTTINTFKLKLDCFYLYTLQQYKEDHEEEYQQFVEEGYTDEEITQYLEITTTKDNEGNKYTGFYAMYNISLVRWGHYPEHLVFGPNVTCINEGPNSSFYNLQDIVFSGDNLYELGQKAFEYCRPTCDLVLPSSLKTIGNYAFRYSHFKCIDLSNTQVTKIPDYCFSHTLASEIKLNDITTTIGEYAFHYANTNQLDLPASLREISEHAFNLSHIKSLDLSRTQVTTIRPYVFAGSDIERIVLNANTTKIGGFAFQGAPLKNIEIPASVTWIDTSAFESTRYLNDLTITGVATIGPCAFKGSGIKNLDLSRSGVSSVQSNTFSGTNMTSLKFSPNHRVRVYKDGFNNAKIQELSLPSVSYIDSQAFCDAKIQNVVIPADTTSVAKDAFKNSTVEYVRILSPNVNIYTQDFPVNDCNLKTLVYLAEPTYSDFDAAVEHLEQQAGLKVEGLKIYGYGGTPLSAFCDYNRIPFVRIDEGGSFPNNQEEAENISYTGNTVQENATKGTCGKIKWKQNGSWLEISGKGEMPSNILTDYNGNEYTVAEYVTVHNIHKIDIQDGVTAIPDNFLYVNEDTRVNVTKVYLPYDLKIIGENAFRNTDVNVLISQAFVYIDASMPSGHIFENAKVAILPEHIKQIGAYAFAGTTGLADYMVMMPNDLLHISEGIFYGSTVKEVYFQSNTAESIGKKAFADCPNLRSLYLSGDITDIYEDTTFDTNILEDEYGEEYEEYLYHTENNAFGYLSDGTLNSQLTVYSTANSSIQTYCEVHGITFRLNTDANDYGYINLEDEGDSFCWKYYSDEKRVDYQFIKKSTNTYENPTKEQVYANYSFAAKTREDQPVITRRINNFNGFEELPMAGASPYLETELINPNRYKVDTVNVSGDVKMIYASNVFEAFNPKVINLCEGIQYLDYNVFGNCPRIEAITLPDSLIEIGTKLFDNCPNLQYVDFGDGITEIPSKVLYNVKGLRFLDIGENTRTIHSQAFYNCTALEEIVIPDNVVQIYSEAFYNCINAQSITIGKNVNYVDNDAFSNLVYCENIVIDSAVMRANDLGSAFRNVGIYTDGVTVTFGDNVQSIDMRLIKNLKCKKLVIGKNVSTIKFLQYTPSTLEEIEIADGNTKFTLKNGMVFNGTYLHLAPRNIRTIKIPEDTTRIGTNAFNGSAITSISIPKNVTNIFDGAFANCKELRTVSLGKGVNVLDDGAFENDASLRLVYFPDNIMRVGERCFKNCKSLSNATFVFDTNNLGSFGEEAFYGCESLTSVVIPQNMREIADNVFQKCTSLNEIYIWNTAVQNNTFMNTNKSLTIHTMAGSPAHAVARTNNINFEAYTDEDAFLDECAIKIDEMAGYVGYCENGHGNIQYLTVYEADCENDGYIIGVCEFCSEILEEVSVPALGHHLTEEIHIPATNSTRGFTVNKCHNCGESFCTYEEPLGDNIAIETHTVKGKVTVAQSDNAQPTPYPISDVKIVIDDMVMATTDKNGNFELTLETGVYEAELRYTYGISRKIYIIIEDADILITEPISMIACDFSKDNRIDEEDMTLFRMVISSKYDDVSYLRFVDLNNDGYINGRDQAYIRGCLGVSASEFSYPNVIISK